MGIVGQEYLDQWEYNMQVKGKHLRYSLYVEGVVVPISSIAISNVTDRSANLQVDVLPIKEAMSFTRGMKVHLFKQEGTGTPILKFYGLLKNQVYIKTFGSRRVQFEIGSMDCRWENMTMVEFSSRNLSASTNVLVARSVISDPDNESKMSAERWKKYQNTADKKIHTVGPAKNAVIGASISMVSEGEGLYGSSRQVAPNDIVKDHAENTTSEEVKDISSLVDVFENEIKKTGGDIPKGILNLINLAYDKANPYTKREGEQVLIKEMVSEIFPGLVSGDSDLLKIDYEKLKSSDSDDIEDAEFNKHDFLRKGILALLKSVMASAEVSIPMDQLINKLMSAIFYTKSVDPTRIQKSINYLPFSFSYFPPRCNVVFPHEYNTLNYNPRAWNQPTRSLVSFPIAAGSKGVYLNNGASSTYTTILADQTDLALKTLSQLIGKSLNPNSDLSAAETYENLIANAELTSDIMTFEESLIGIIPNIKRIDNPMLAGITLSSANMLANYFHQMAKLGVRTCSVRGALLDDLIVGLPIIILDGHFSIHGILQHYTYSIAENGSVSTDLSIACPKYISLEDLPTPALWLANDIIKPDSIGKYYMDTYGCSSVYDPDIEYKSGIKESDILRASVSNLINRYNAAEDKHDFAEKYKVREHLTMRDVFEDIHKCSGVQVRGMSTDKEVAQATIWKGPLFSSYQIEPLKIPNSSVILEYPIIDKQKIVVDFLEKYYNNPALIAE